MTIGNRPVMSIECNLRRRRRLCSLAALNTDGTGAGCIVLMQVREGAVAELAADTDFTDRAPAVDGGEGVEQRERSNQFGGVGYSTSVAKRLQNSCILLRQERI